MGKLLVLGGLAAAVAGAGFAGYNAFYYETLQPFPLAWNHDAEEQGLLELLRLRREVEGRLGSIQRTVRAGGLHLPPEVTGGPSEALGAELEALDARIAALRATLRARAAPALAR